MASPPVAGSTPPTKNTALRASANPAADAVICLPTPAALHCRPVKDAVPLPAAEPISWLVVPSKEPLPPVKVRTTLKLAGNPAADVLPYASCAMTTGCVPKGEPLRDVPPGWAVNTNWLAAPGPTIMLSEVAPVRPLLVKPRLIVLARLCDKLAKLATPLTAVAVNVPCKVPLPALRATVTTVVLSVVCTLPY